MIIRKILAFKPLTKVSCLSFQSIVLIKNVFKVLFVGTGAGAGYTAYTVDSVEDLRQLGLLRFGRAASTVSCLN